MRIRNLLNRSYRGAVRDDGLLRSLDLIVLSAACGTILFANTAGAALTGYASAFGAGEFMFGLISALPILAGLSQLFVSYLVEKTGSRKALFLAGGIAQRLLWIVAAFIPHFLPGRLAPLRAWALLAIITAAAVAGSFVNVTHVSMVAEVVPIGIRGIYITARQRVTTLFSLAAGLGAAFVLDHTRGFTGFTIVFGVGGVAGLIDILMYAGFKFPAVKRGERRFSFADGFKECFRAPKTRDYLVFWGVWGFAINLSSTFFNKYSLDVLRLSFLQVIVFGQLVANVVTIFVITRWGRFIDRYGCAPLLFLTGTATSLVMIAWLPATPGSIAPVLIFNLLGGFVWCGTDATALNMQLSHTPDIGRPLALAIYTIVTSSSAALAFIAGGSFLELMAPVMRDAGLTLFGTPFDHYKLLFAITAVLRFAAIAVFLPRVWNEKGLTAREAYADIAARGRAWLGGAALYLRERSRRRREALSEAGGRGTHRR
ncbi:MAG: MFS transporter [Clostridiales bacterium]|jgi:MFS family permease|nr:MFS transporter [Clostridiales bacterium]